MRIAALALLALALSGCESTQQKSAQLEKAALAHEKAIGGNPAHHGLSIIHLSTRVHVLSTTLIKGAEGTAVVVTLANTSATAIRDVPIALAVSDAQGAVVYTNSAPGLSQSLVSVPLIPAHGQGVWVYDQVAASGTPATASAKVGEGTAVTGPIPLMTVEQAHVFEESATSTGAEGNIVNHSTIEQQELLVDALALRAGKIVAAGRAVIQQVPAGVPTRFQLYFSGSPKGAQLQVTAPASTFE